MLSVLLLRDLVMVARFLRSKYVNQVNNNCNSRLDEIVLVDGKSDQNASTFDDVIDF